MSHDIHHCHCAEHCAVRIRDLGVRIGSVTILENVTATIPRGVCTAIVGPNGAGKTTLARSILGELPHTGTIEFGVDGKFTPRPPRFGYVPQKLNFDRDMPLTVLEYLASGLVRRPVFFGVGRKFRAQAADYLEQVECLKLIDRPLGALSGGELQRVLLAQALMQDPDILLLDEPAAGIDFKGEQLLCELLEKFRRKLGFTQLMVSHDLSMVAAHAAHVICINRTVFAAGAPGEVLTQEVLHETFGLHVGKVELRKHGEVCSCCH
ncbi:MAG: metal ABC transporter ATP-binding protein [Lentisphaeria bacterium]|nr:metal ABC transporter ATP-binding protein [Lentisphaeria bacterium]